MTATCPICGKVKEWHGNAFRPFCSERCRLVDLDGWLTERYGIPLSGGEGASEPDENGSYIVSDYPQS